MSKIVIVGGGPAGYCAAIGAAQIGANVVVVEQSKLGGTCLNEGCIPTKSLLESTEFLGKVKAASMFGVDLPVGQVVPNWMNIQRYKQKVVNQLVLGIGYLMKNKRIEVIQGKAIFLRDRLLEVKTSQGCERLEADRFIIATGSEPVGLSNTMVTGEWLLFSHHVLSLAHIPKSLVIVGGGVIGCEFASIFGRLGTQVTIIELAEYILPGEDPDIAELLRRQLERESVRIHTLASITDLDAANKRVRFNTSDGERQEIQAEYVLIAVGRKPRVNGFGLESTGVAYTRQGIQVNDFMQTNVPHIYACGDVTGGLQLAHLAFHEGEIAAANACGVSKRVNRRAIPRCIYTSPEVASVGMTIDQARQKYGDVHVGEFPLSANGRALIHGEKVGKVKIIVTPEFHEIVGMTVIGPLATELIGQGAMMIHAEMTVEAVEDLVVAHPTLSEAVREATLQTIGKAVHI